MRWFHRRWLNEAMGGGAGTPGARLESSTREVAPGVPFRFPGQGAVSRELMDAWRAAAPPATPLDALPDAVLCPGRQKYVLVLVEDPASGAGKLVVRGGRGGPRRLNPHRSRERLAFPCAPESNV